jgi:hypothetical protein
MNDEYEQRQFWDEKILNPKIIHFSCSGDLDNESVMMINKMVELAYVKDFKNNKNRV